MLKLRPIQIIGLAALAAPVAYIIGRYASALNPGSLASAALVAIAFGALLGIPIGLFFGSVKNPATPAPIHTHPDMTKQQDKILQQLQEELNQNKNLFEARKGNQAFLTRISYLNGFWTAAKASGQLFVMQEPKLLNTIATAYYWIDQANHLETLAYESQYNATAVVDNQNATTHLIAEARLLDGPLGVALQNAVDAISQQLRSDDQLPNAPFSPQN